MSNETRTTAVHAVAEVLRPGLSMHDQRRMIGEAVDAIAVHLLSVLASAADGQLAAVHEAETKAVTGIRRALTADAIKPATVVGRDAIERLADRWLAEHPHDAQGPTYGKDDLVALLMQAAALVEAP